MDTYKKVCQALSSCPDDRELVEALEAIVDKSTLQNVIHALSCLCSEKADHLRSNWSDAYAAKGWDRDATRLDKAWIKIEN